jgi:hypothetical protein
MGSTGHKLNRRSNANDCSIPGSLVCDPKAIKFPQYPFVLYSSNDANSSYQAMIAKFQHQLSGGLSFLANYTVSKALGNGMGAQPAAATTSQMAACLRCDKGPTFYNVPQRLVMSGIWDVPVGRGQHYLQRANRALDGVIGGWQVSAIVTFAAGNPFTVWAPNRSGAVFTDFRADRLCDGRGGLSNTDLRTNGGYALNPECFAAPAPGLFGTSGVGILNGPGVNNWDIGLAKNLSLSEFLRFQFRTEFFNAFNHAQFGIPDPNVASLNFGRVSGTQVNARIIQFAAKLLW